MQQLETDLATISLLAEQREEENYRFRSFLKSTDENKIDQIVHKLNDDISSVIDCTKCGNCCKSLMITIAVPERKVFAEHFNVTELEAEEKYLSKGLDGDTVMNKMPCIFLAENKCTIYEKRFTDCREFPHLHKDRFTTRLFSVMYNYGMCPIVFNVMEALKEELEWSGL